MHGQIDAAHISKWLRQYDELETHRWVGERLLKVLDYWSEDRLTEKLALTLSGLGEFDAVCVNLRTPGKSSSVLANLIKKRIDNYLLRARLLDFYDAVCEPGGTKILFVEDCMLSGTEMTRLLQAFLNLTPAGRSPKTPPVPDVSVLRSKSIELRFGVIANLGYEIVQRFLVAHELTNVAFFDDTEGQLLTLTGEGLRAIERGDFIEGNCVADPERYLNRVAFQSEVWGAPDRVRRAREFCALVGAQLWRQYLSHMQWEWPERRIVECGLGMRGQALALAFAHSVPKSTLPLFWMAGSVTVGKNTVSWTPLFPNAL
jgi:hypothetical protein